MSYKYYDITKLNESLINEKIWIRGRIHTIRNTKSNCFVILRDQGILLQAIGFRSKYNSVPTFKDLCALSNESVVDFYGYLNKAPVPIEFTTYKTIEFVIESYQLISPSDTLPFVIDDANNTDNDDSFRCHVDLSLRLDKRWLDLRTPLNHSIITIKSGICQLFREYLYQNEFIEIQSPKIISNASESGANIFKLNYFGKDAFLAQSPQLYKQMAINSDFDRVFEVGPVFRAENSLTHRHLCEFTGLDIEMVIPPDRDYYFVLEFIWGLLVYIFNNVAIRYNKQIDIIKQITPFELPVYNQTPLIIKFSECVQMIRDAGGIQPDLEDLSTENERLVGNLIKAKYGVDLFVIDKYPTAVRPFYTMQDSTDQSYSNSYDIIFRSQEISSGAQRIHDYSQLLTNIKSHNISSDSLKYYLDSFKHGSKPHAGCGFGLERLVAFYLNIDNIRKISLCARDPKRLTP